MPMHRLVCECNSVNCSKTVDIPVATFDATRLARAVIIVDGCETGPEPTDELIEKREGYSIYEEQEPSAS